MRKSRPEWSGQSLTQIARAVDRKVCTASTWLTNWQTNWLIDWLTDWLRDWLTHCLPDWLTEWPPEWLTNWITSLPARLRRNQHLKCASPSVCVPPRLEFHIFRTEYAVQNEQHSPAGFLLLYVALPLLMFKSFGFTTVGAAHLNGSLDELGGGSRAFRQPQGKMQLQIFNLQHCHKLGGARLQMLFLLLHVAICLICARSI